MFASSKTISKKPELCDTCRAIDTSKLDWIGTTWLPHKSSFRVLQKSARNCPLCKLLHDGLAEASKEYTKPIFLLYQALQYLNRTRVQIAGFGRDGKGGVNQLKVNFGTSHDLGFRLGVFADPDDPAAISGPFYGRVVKPANDFATARSWVDTCRKSHKSCARANPRQSPPTRLIDVGGDSLRVVPGKICKVDFATLSHCWGSKLIIQLTKSTESVFEKKIEWNQLSKTFQDAVEITRALGIQYLWIDSLCIIQDDSADWERESASMARTYAQAFLNIAACASSDGSGGCFKDRPGPDQFVDLQHTGEEGGTIKIGPVLRGFGKSVGRSPLLSRGWVVQERLLSRRKLYYAEDQLYWHCSEDYKSESGDHTTDDDFRLDVDRNFATSTKREEQFELWHNLVVDFTSCKLTRNDDKLPAISGLAQKFSAATGCHYNAGLWRENLIGDLLWQVGNSPSLKYTPTQSSRYSTYIAPSWSWASIEGRVCFPATYGYPEITIVDVRIKLAGLDPHGHISSARLSINGRLQPVLYRYSPDRSGPSSTDRMFRATEMLLAPKHWGNLFLLPNSSSSVGNDSKDILQGDAPLAEEEIGYAYLDEDKEPEGLVYCLKVIGGDVLLLQLTGKKQEYRRIGKGYIPLDSGKALFGLNDKSHSDSPEVRIYLV